MRFTLVILAIIAIFWLIPPVSAQCAFMDVDVVPGNPFSAERVSTHSNPGPVFSSNPAVNHPQFIARDSQGRVRIESIPAKYKMQSGPDQGQELEQHIITICDPVSKTLTQIDTINKTARISHTGPRNPAPSNFKIAQTSLCETKSRIASFPNSRIEALGHQNILGFDAKGTRMTHTSAFESSQGNNVSATTTVQEEWCAEELGAVLQQTNSSVREGKTVFSTETSLTKLERVEPDAALFQIPPGYTISELIPNPPPRRPPFAVQTPAAPAGATSPPQK